jgi:hypothetical protein
VTHRSGRAEALARELSATPSGPAAGWQVAGRVGAFRGFDGHFDEAPLLLDAGTSGSRHRFWVRAGTAVYRLDADVFGWSCRADAADFPVGEASAKRRAKAPPALPAGATSFVVGERLLACTLTDSFRVRVLVPLRMPV